jgi:hypothetical protein
LTCYLRHIKQLLENNGIEVTAENKREIDSRIHELMGVGYKDCPGAWRELKKRIAEDEPAFIASLKESLAKA